MPCPSAHDRARNRHRDGHAWSKGAVRAILGNPRYTGHEVWNKQHKEEILLDIDDVTLGHRTKLSWNTPDQWIWSAQPVHEPLISMDTFTRAGAKQLTRRSGVPERSPRTTNRAYPLGGRLRSGICRRKMPGNYNNGQPYYRCRYTAEYAKSAALEHPLTVYVRQNAILPALDTWLARVFAPGHLGRTIRAMCESQQRQPAAAPALEAARRTITETNRRIDRYRAALDAGADPAVVAGWITAAQNEQTAARQQLAAASDTQREILNEEQIHHMIKTLGDVADRLQAAEPEDKAPLYADFGLELEYHAHQRVVTVWSQPADMCVFEFECPRGDLNPHAR
ncbi:recombinase family protein [Streptomyces lydicus]